MQWLLASGLSHFKKHFILLSPSEMSSIFSSAILAGVREILSFNMTVPRSQVTLIHISVKKILAKHV